METVGKLIRVTTPQELEAILDRLKSQHATSLAVIGPEVELSSDPNSWPVSWRGQSVYQLSRPWSFLSKVIRLHHLDQLILRGLGLDNAEIRMIAKHLTQLTSLDVGKNGIGEAGDRAIAEHLLRLTSLDVGYSKI